MNTQTSVKAEDNGGIEVATKKTNRRSFTERLADLSLEKKVEVIKELKKQVEQELKDKQDAAASAASLAQGL